VDQVVQGSPEALGPKWLTGNRHRPSGLVWSGEDTLCGGRGDPLPLLGYEYLIPYRVSTQVLNGPYADYKA
jgi:hypothetical protein